MIIWRGFLFTWDKYSDALKFGETIVDCLSPARKPYGWQLQEISQVDRKNVLIAEWKKTITKRISGFINMFGIQIRGKRITLNKTNETLLSRIKTVGSTMHPPTHELWIQWTREGWTFLKNWQWGNWYNLAQSGSSEFVHDFCYLQPAGSGC